MSDVEVRFNTVELLNSLEEPFHQANEIMGRRTQQEVRTDKWQWPRETERKRTGKTGSPRNIIDEGTFAASHSTNRVAPNIHEHRFDTEYALAVVLGAVLSNGTTLPGRNPFEEPAKRLPDDFAKLAEAELAKVKDPP